MTGQGRMRESVQQEFERITERMDNALLELEGELHQLLTEGLGDIGPEPGETPESEHLRNLMGRINPTAKVSTPKGFFWAHHARLDKMANHMEVLHGLAKKANLALFGITSEQPTETPPESWQMPPLPITKAPSVVEGERAAQEDRVIL